MPSNGGKILVPSLVGGLLLLVACGGPSQERHASTSPLRSASATDRPEPEATEGISQPRTDDGPSNPRELPDGVAATYYADMAELAEIMRLSDPPSVTPIRAVTRDEIDQVKADCLTEQGFPAEVEDSGGISYEVPSGQQGSARIASYTCSGQYPLRERYSQTLSEEQLQVYYDWIVEETIPCMQDLGYPTPEPPTLETFMAEYAKSNALFFPDGDLDPGSIADDMHTVLEHCEVMPPDKELYGQSKISGSSQL